MSTILDALKRVEEELRKTAETRHAGQKSPDGLTSAHLSNVRDDAPIQPQEAVSGGNDEVMKVYSSLVDMIARIQDRAHAVVEEGRAETRKTTEELAKAMAALQDAFARQTETYQDEILQREAEREDGNAALAAAHSEIAPLRQAHAETKAAVAELAKTMATLQDDFARQTEAHQTESRQREAEREDGNAALAAAHSEIAPLRQAHAETKAAVAELAKTLAALQGDLAHQTEAHQTESRQREAERADGKAALAAAHSEIAPLRQAHAETKAAVAELAKTMATLQDDFARQTAAHQTESRQREAEREDGNAALAAAHSEIAPLRQAQAETKESIEELAQVVATLQKDFASQTERYQSEIRQRHAKREDEKTSAAAQAQIEPLIRAHAETKQTVAELAKTLAALQGDLAHQTEAYQNEIRQRDLKLDDGKAVVLAAAQAQVEPLIRAHAEIKETVAELAKTLAALQGDFAHQTEAYQNEIQQRDAERKAAIDTLAQTMAACQNEFARQRVAHQEEVRRWEAEREAERAALAAAQVRIDSLRQLLVDHEAAEARAQDETLAARGGRASAGLDGNAPTQAAVREDAVREDGTRRMKDAPISESSEPKASRHKEEVLRLHRAAAEAHAQGDFAEALRLLDIIDSAFPDNKSILYNRAMCLIGLGRNNEARRLCDYLVTTLKHPPAEELKNTIKD